MDGVARAGGATKPTLYAHFGSKRELFDATVDAESERLLDFLFAAYGRALAGSPSQLMRACVGAFFDYADHHPDGFELLFRSARSAHDAELVENTIQRITARVTEIVERELDAAGRLDHERARVQAAAIVGVSHHVVLQAAVKPTADRESAIDFAAAFASGGFFATLPPKRDSR
jgi:AcrR family transcriptional regulator